MVTDIHRDASPMDVWLEFDSQKIGYRLLADPQSGLLGWRQGFAPVIAPQVRDSEYSYQHQHPEVDIAVPFEDWGLGAGFFDIVPGAPRRGYNYSQGLDLSWPNRVYLSPARQDAKENDATEIAAAPVKFLDTSLGFFCIAGAYIYEWDTTNLDWIERDDASGDGQNYTDLAEMDGILYAARGDSADYKYSSNGTTWTAFTDADRNFKFFAVRGQSSAEAVLWGVTGTGLLRNTTNGQNSGVAWSSGDQIGHTSETVNGMIEADNRLYVFKREGIFSYDGTTLDDVWLGGRKMLRAGNGKNPFLSTNGNIYVPYGDRLMEYDPLANDGAGSIAFVWPHDFAVGNSELNGTIDAIAAGGGDLYFTLKNADGNTYVMKGFPGAGFHSWAYLGANDCDALLVAGPTSVASANPVLMFGYGTGARYFILPRSGLRPEDDTNYRYDTTEGVAYGPNDPVGVKAYKKFLNGGRLVTQNTTAGMPATLAYEVDGGSESTLLTATGAGESSASLSTIVDFNRLRYVLRMSTPNTASSPRVLSIVFSCVPNPPRKRMWTLDIRIGDHMAQRGGGESPVSARHALDHLERALSKRVTLYDRRSRTFTVNVTDVAGLGVLPKQQGDEEIFRTTMVEIAETTASGNGLVWDEGGWNQGYVWGSAA